MISLKSEADNVVAIKVVGVGGAGNNVVNRMFVDSIQGIEYIAVNTDKQVLTASIVDKKIQIGEQLTRGQGAGANPEIGRDAAQESRNLIADALDGADMVFLAGGMGGGTGTGALPVVANIAKEAGILTVAVVTKPFSFEGKQRKQQAQEGIRNLLEMVDSLLIIPNDRLKLTSDNTLTLANAFSIADEVLHQAIESISDLIKNTGFINLDFADITTVMKDAGYAHMGVGRSSGKKKAENAAQQAVSSPLMEKSIAEAKGVLINITCSTEIDLEDVEIAANLVKESAHPEADIMFGAVFDATMKDEMRVTVIATRFENTLS